MPKTNKIARFVKEPAGLERSYPGGAHSKPAMLYLLALRSRHAEIQSPVPKRKLVITLDFKADPDGSASQIKINRI